MPESEEETRRRTRWETHERYLIGKRLRRRDLVDGCLGCLVVGAAIFAALLWAAYHVFPR